MTKAQQTFIDLVRLGVGVQCDAFLPEKIDWEDMLRIAMSQCLSPIVLDGVSLLPEDKQPPKDLLLRWIGYTVREEQHNAVQWEKAKELAIWMADVGIKTYVLKGYVIAECYPIPKHRMSVDLDCYLRMVYGGEDAWEIGNTVVEKAGVRVERDYYKNSTWYLPGLIVENHKWLTPFRGNKRLASFEGFLQRLIKKDNNGADSIRGTALYRPPVMVSALFLIEHAYSHFLHEGLTWRHILDWSLFCRKYDTAIDWTQFNYYIDQFGFRSFYDSYSKIGEFLLGEQVSFIDVDRLMIKDLWAELDTHKTVKGLIGKLALVGNTWRARWKYRLFSEDSWLKALWIQVKGFLFVKNPMPC